MASRLFPVQVKNTDGNLLRCTIRYSATSNGLILETNEQFAGKLQLDNHVILNDSIIINSKGVSESIRLEKRIIVNLEPIVITSLPYSTIAGSLIEDIYPPSSNGFYGRIVEEGEKATFTIHKIQNSELLWLFVFNRESGDVIEAHTIYPYEIGVFTLTQDWEIDRRSNDLIEIDKEELKQLQDGIDEILNGPPPSWSQIALLLKDVTIPNMQRERTMRDTVSRLVPDWGECQAAVEALLSAHQ